MFGIKRQQQLLWFLLTLLACLGNYFVVPLLFGVELLLGGFFLYLILFNFGLARALMSALPAYLTTWLVWGHPWIGIICFFELLLVGALLRHFKSRDLILLIAGYWLLVGSPASLLIYAQLLGVPWLDVWMLIGKQALNSLAAATLALLVAYLLSSRFSSQQRVPQLSITDLFFYVPTLLLVLGGFVVIVVTGYFQMQRAEQEIQRQLTLSQEFIARQLEAKLDHLHQALLQINEKCNRLNLQPLELGRSCFDRHLVNLPFEQVFLRSMMDADWTAFSQQQSRRQLNDAKRQLLNKGLNQLVAEGKDRTQLLAEQDELLLVRRVFDSEGRQDWLAGSISLNHFRVNLMTAVNHPDLRYAWQLEERQLLISQVDQELTLPAQRVGNASHYGEFMHWLPDHGESKVTRWRDSIFYIEQPMQNLGLKLPGHLRVELIPRLVQESLFQLYGLLFTLAFLMILLGLLLSRWIARKVAQPVQELIQVADRIPTQLKLPIQSWSWPQTYPIVEFEQLKEHLIAMGRLLKDQFSQLQSKEQQLGQMVSQRTRELVDANQHLQSVMESMEAVLWSAELNQTANKDWLSLSFISSSVLQLTGSSARTWLAQPQQLLYKGLAESERARVLEELQKMPLSGRGRILLHFKHQINGQWRVLTLRYWLVYSDEGQPLRVDGLITDITEAHAAEEKVKAQEELLLHQSRRAAMGEMLSNIAHQWRQPLNSLRLTLGNLEDAKNFGELSEEVFDQSLVQADRQINQMNQTVRDFVTFFRPRKEVQVFELSKLINQALEVMGASLDQVKVDCQLTCEAEVEGYPNEVMQVMMVLLQNAREALEARQVAEPRIKIRLEKLDQQVILTLEDNAGGIPEEVISQVFDPYFTTKAEGTGIGLYMAKMVIEKQMQCGIQVDNSDQGAVFTLSFPQILDAKSN